MNDKGFDKRLCQASLDGLKSYRRSQFTIGFLERHGLPIDKKLDDMWARIKNWIGNDASRYEDLWEYVDELRLWGRQRVFLYEVDEGYATELSDPQYVKGIVGSVYGKPLFQWEAEEPFLAEVKHTQVESTGTPLLIFKLIENQKYNLVIKGQSETFEERSTNFFIINLQDRYAELRIQELPTGAVRDIREERKRLETAIGKYLDFKRLEAIDLVPVMDVLLRVPIYTVTSSRLRFPETDASPKAPELVAFLNNLFKRSEPAELTAFWDCSQKILGKSQLHFQLSGTSDFVGFGGIADPDRMSDILKKLVDIKRRPQYFLNKGEPAKSPRIKKGIVAEPLKNLQDHPKAQAVVLSAGAIAASVIWHLADAIRKYLLDKMLGIVLEGLLGTIIIIVLEIVWIIYYYGWSRVWRGLKILLSLPRPEVWRALKEAKKRSEMEKSIAS